MTDLPVYAPTKLYSNRDLDQLEVGFEFEFASEFNECEVANKLSHHPELADLVHHVYEDGPAKIGQRPTEIVTNWWPVSEAKKNMVAFCEYMQDDLGAYTYTNSSCHINYTYVDKRSNSEEFWNRKNKTRLIYSQPPVGIHKFLERSSHGGWCESWIHHLASSIRRSSPSDESLSKRLKGAKDMVKDIWSSSRKAICLTWGNDHDKRVEFRVGGGQDYHKAAGIERLQLVTDTCAAYLLAIRDNQPVIDRLVNQNIELAANLSKLSTDEYVYYSPHQYVDESEWEEGIVCGDCGEYYDDCSCNDEEIYGND